MYILGSRLWILALFAYGLLRLRLAMTEFALHILQSHHIGAIARIYVGIIELLRSVFCNEKISIVKIILYKTIPMLSSLVKHSPFMKFTTPKIYLGSKNANPKNITTLIINLVI